MLKPALAITVFLSALLGCKAPLPTPPTRFHSLPNRERQRPGSVSHKKRVVHPAPRPPDAKAVKVDLANAVTENASDPDDRWILASGDTCRIEVPPTGPSTATHEYEDVDCPPDYDDPAWDACSYLITHTSAGCYCLGDGEDPPPPRPTVCPALERTRNGRDF